MNRKSILRVLCILSILVLFGLPIHSGEVEGTDVEQQISEDLDGEIREDYEVYEEDEGLEWTYGGKIESVHGLGLLRNGEYIASRNFVNAYVGLSYGASYAKISGSAEYNYRNTSRTGFRLNEAYYKYRNSIFELCMGRQQIVWGQADGFNITNVIASKDMREFTATSNDDSLLPSDAVRLKFFHDIFTFDIVAIPFFTPNIMPQFSFELGGNIPPFYIDLPAKQDVNILSVPIFYKKQEAEMPKRFLDTEAGMRLSFTLPQIDFSLSCFYGWERTPMFVREGIATLEEKQILPPPFPKTNVPTSISINIKPEYYRVALFGTDGAIPIGDVLLRYEAAYVWGRYFEAKKQIGTVPTPSGTEREIVLPFNKPIRKNQLLLLAGLDWNYDGWSLSAQYFEDLILDHKDDIQRSLHQGTISLNFSKFFLRETLKLGITGAIGVNYGDTFSTYSVDYAITDNFHIATGFDVYTKGYDGKGRFATMNNMSSYWLRGRFSF